MSGKSSSENSLNVGIVGRCLNVPHIRGIGRYIFEILRGLGQESGVAWRVFANDNRYSVAVPSKFDGEIDIFHCRGDRFELWEQIGVPSRGIWAGCDIIHYTEGVMALWQPKPSVITLHDTIAWDNIPDNAFAEFYYQRLMPAALRKAAAIITISKSAERDICARWPDLADKIKVIGHGIGCEYLKDSHQSVRSSIQMSLNSTPYLLYLGGPMERKRFGWAVDALVACDTPGLHLVACGFGPDDAASAMRALPSEMRGRIHFAPFLSDMEMLALYQSASAVLYPTLYEGFGFPAIEAQAAGVPVIFSPVSSLNELIGPLAILAATHDMNSWVTAIMTALRMGGERLVRAEQARAWVRKYSWEQSARAHLEVYQSTSR